MPHNVNCCGRCGKEVYHAEKKIAINKVWHELCFSCVKCNKLLCPANFCTYKNELYCRFCYTKVSQYDIEYSSSDLSEISNSCPPTCNNKKPYSPPPNSEIKETSNLKPSEIKNLIKNKLKKIGSNISLYSEKIKTFKDKLTSKKSCVSQTSQCSVANPELLFVSESGTTKIIKITTPCPKLNYCDDSTCPYRQKLTGTPVCQSRKTNTNRKCCKFNEPVIEITPENPKKCCKASQCGFLKPDCGSKRSRRTVEYPCDSKVNVETNTKCPQESHETQYECPRSKRNRRKFSRRRFRSGSDINLRRDDTDYNLRKSDRTRLNLQQSLKNTTYVSQNNIKIEEKPVSHNKTTSTSDSEQNINEIFDKKYEHKTTYNSGSKTFPKNSRKDSKSLELNHFQTSARRTTVIKQNDKQGTIHNHNLKETIKKESYIPPKYDPNQKQIENPHFLENFKENKPQRTTKEHFSTLKSLIPFHKRKTTKTIVHEPVGTSKQDKRDTESLKLSKIETPTNQETIESIKLSTNNEKTKELKEHKNKFSKSEKNKTKNDYAALDDFTTPIKYSFYKTRKENSLEKEESIYPPSIDKTKKQTSFEQEESIYPPTVDKTNDEPPNKTTEKDNPRNSKKQKQSVKKNDNAKKSKDNKENVKKSKDNKENSKKSKDNKENKSMLGKLFFFPTAHRKKKLENQKKSIFKRMHSGQCQIHKKISCYEEKFIVTAEISPNKTYIRNSRKKISETENNIDNNKIVPLPPNTSLPAAGCYEENSIDVASFSKTRRNFCTRSRRLNNELCGRCNKKVYIMERCIADNGVFHKKCFTCFFCKKILDSLSVVPKLNEILCKQCYMRFYGPQLYGFGMKQNLREI